LNWGRQNFRIFSENETQRRKNARKNRVLQDLLDLSIQQERRGEMFLDDIVVY
jgi:hypothetical protein